MYASGLRIVVLTAGNTQKSYTYRLRVELLLPHLAALGLQVETRQWPRDAAQVRALLDSLAGHDIAWLHRRLLWPSELKRLRRSVPHLVLDIDDPINLSSSTWFNFSLHRCLKFRATARRCSAVLAASQGLVAQASPWNANVHHIPLGVDPSFMNPNPTRRQPGEPLRVMWIGSQSTFKYLRAITPQLEAMGQAVPNIEFIVVGHESLTLKHGRVYNVPWSPASEKEWMARAHVGLAPMADNRWTRSKAALKPLQYLAAGMPFIGPPVGVNVAYAEGSQNAFLVRSLEEWANAVRRFAYDEKLRQDMGARGQQMVKQKHAPVVLAGQVAEVFQRLAGQRSHSSAA